MVVALYSLKIAEKIKARIGSRSVISQVSSSRDRVLTGKEWGSIQSKMLNGVRQWRILRKDRWINVPACRAIGSEAGGIAH